MNPLDFPLLADENIHIQTLRTVAAQPLNVQSPSIVVAEQTDQTVQIGIRQL